MAHENTPIKLHARTHVARRMKEERRQLPQSTGRRDCARPAAKECQFTRKRACTSTHACTRRCAAHATPPRRPRKSAM
eukprot:199899-Alexandrium_andersonii.AAC.1